MRKLILAVLFILLVAADITSKKMITSRVNYRIPISEVSGIVNRDMKALYDGEDFIPVAGQNGDLMRFELYFNRRFAFSLGPVVDEFSFLFNLFAMVALILYLRKNPVGTVWGWLLVFAGNTGNLIDKLFLKSLYDRSWLFSISSQSGYTRGVVDFISAKWFGFSGLDFFPLTFLSWPRWPIFNVADSLVVVGAGILIYSFTFLEKEKPASLPG